MLLLNTFLWFPPLQAVFIILHCNLLQYLFVILLLILALSFLLHWVPLYMATLFLLFIIIQPLYLVLTPQLVPLFEFLSRLFLSNLLLIHGLFLTLFTILSLCMPLLAIPAIFLVLMFLLFQPFSLVLPLLFLTPILLKQLFLTLLNPIQIVCQERGSPGVDKGGGVEATPIVPPGNLIPSPLFSTPHLPTI